MFAGNLEDGKMSFARKKKRILGEFVSSCALSKNSDNKIKYQVQFIFKYLLSLSRSKFLLYFIDVENHMNL